MAEAQSAAASSVRFGVDIGGTKTEVIAVDESGRILGGTKRATTSGVAAVVASVVDGVRAVQESLGIGDAESDSLGIGIPGLVDNDRGRVLHAVNLDVESLDLADLVHEALGMPVRVENDVKAAAIGAAALRGDDRPLAYLNLGTGVAAGIVVGGSIWRGARGIAGEVGHIAVDPEGRECTCGQRGCIETLAGGGALARAWGRGGDLPVRDIFDAAERGDALAVELRGDLARGAAAAVRVLVLTTDVETVIVGGGLSALGGRLDGDIRAALRADAEGSPFLRSLQLDERIEMLPPGSPAAALGAALVGASSTVLSPNPAEGTPPGASVPPVPPKESVVHG